AEEERERLHCALADARGLRPDGAAHAARGAGLAHRAVGEGAQRHGAGERGEVRLDRPPRRPSLCDAGRVRARRAHATISIAPALGYTHLPSGASATSSPSCITTLPRTIVATARPCTSTPLNGVPLFFGGSLSSSIVQR